MREVISRNQGGVVAAWLRPQPQHDTSNKAEGAFSKKFTESEAAAFNALLEAVGETTEVHRTVLPYRAWDLLDIIGHDHAHTLLRQSVRYCVKAENWGRNKEYDEPRTLLPQEFRG